MFIISSIFILILCFIINITQQQITVHVVPHTHDDAGWCNTFDQYYYGKNTTNCVKDILDNMILTLSDNENRTFIYVEMAFFIKWYKDQNEFIRMQAKQLVKENRLEFINGGYVMHDEADTYYQHIIDQMRLGLL